MDRDQKRRKEMERKKSLRMFITKASLCSAAAMLLHLQVLACPLRGTVKGINVIHTTVTFIGQMARSMPCVSAPDEMRLH